MNQDDFQSFIKSRIIPAKWHMYAAIGQTLFNLNIIDDNNYHIGSDTNSTAYVVKCMIRDYCETYC